jgi:hypothetical protein
MRILNVLAQTVAIPVFEGAAPNSLVNVPASLNKQPVSNLRLPCGDYNAYWDGNYQGTTKEAASGIYIVWYTVDGGKALTRKIRNSK